MFARLHLLCHAFRHDLDRLGGLSFYKIDILESAGDEGMMMTMMYDGWCVMYDDGWWLATATETCFLALCSQLDDSGFHDFASHESHHQLWRGGWSRQTNIQRESLGLLLQQVPLRRGHWNWIIENQFFFRKHEECHDRFFAAEKSEHVKFWQYLILQQGAYDIKLRWSSCVSKYFHHRPRYYRRAMNFKSYGVESAEELVDLVKDAAWNLRNSVFWTFMV